MTDAGARKTKFRTIVLEPAPHSTDEHKMGAIERAVASEEVDGYEFYSLTFVGVLEDGSQEFVAAFRRAAPSADKK